VNTTGWLRGLEVTVGGAGIVSHAGVALLRALADRTGLTGGLSRALASDRLLVHDRGRELVGHSARGSLTIMIPLARSMIVETAGRLITAPRPALAHPAPGGPARQESHPWLRAVVTPQHDPG
jgi:hypothetical protein